MSSSCPVVKRDVGPRPGAAAFIARSAGQCTTYVVSGASGASGASDRSPCVASNAPSRRAPRRSVDLQRGLLVQVLCRRRVVRQQRRVGRDGLGAVGRDRLQQVRLPARLRRAHAGGRRADRANDNERERSSSRSSLPARASRCAQQIGRSGRASPSSRRRCRGRTRRRSSNRCPGNTAPAPPCASGWPRPRRTRWGRAPRCTGRTSAHRRRSPAAPRRCRTRRSRCAGRRGRRHHSGADTPRTGRRRRPAAAARARDRRLVLVNLAVAVVVDAVARLGLRRARRDRVGGRGVRVGHGLRRMVGPAIGASASAASLSRPAS